MFRGEPKEEGVLLHSHEISDQSSPCLHDLDGLADVKSIGWWVDTSTRRFRTWDPRLVFHALCQCQCRGGSYIRASRTGVIFSRRHVMLPFLTGRPDEHISAIGFDCHELSHLQWHS